MEKIIRFVKKGQDFNNQKYWLTLSDQERMLNLEAMRQEVNARLYGDSPGFQRVHRFVKRWSATFLGCPSTKQLEFSDHCLDFWRVRVYPKLAKNVQSKPFVAVSRLYIGH